MRPILAIALHTLREAQSKRIFYALPFLVIGTGVLLPRLGFGGGEASPRERFHLLVSYGLGFPVFLISLFTIAHAAGLARDIETHRIHSLVTKPVGPWDILFGRFVGVLLLAAGLWGVAMVPFLLSILALRASVPAAPREVEPGEKLLVPRTEVGADFVPPDPAAVTALAAALAREGRGGRSASQGELEARARRILRSFRLNPGESKELTFGGKAGADSGDRLPLRFVAQSLRPWDTGRVSLVWEVQAKFEGGREAPATMSANLVPHAIPTEILLPRGSVAVNGLLRVKVRSAESPDTGVPVIIDPAAVRVLPASGTFAGSLAAATWLLCCRWALLGSITLAASALFRFPTAVLLGLFVHVSALASGFLRETFEVLQGESDLGGLSEHAAEWTARFGAAALELVPDFSRLDPLSRLGSSLEIAWSELGGETLWLGGIECTALLLLGAICLGRRELGK